MNEVVLKRGAVYYLKTDDSVGRELAIGRPVVILSNSKEIENNDCVIVGMLTNTGKTWSSKGDGEKSFHICIDRSDQDD